jgi:hypothetical protein
MVGPKTLTLRSYGVGFGDCFLLSFHYDGNRGDRHVLIDFGMTQKPPNPVDDLMKKIAKDIASVVGKRLHVVVATHRHADHISGFATTRKGTGPGDIIAKLEPQLVIQPWTERPDAPKDFKGTEKAITALANDALRLSLTHMSAVARGSIEEAKHLPRAAASQITFIGKDGVSNMSAVENLAKMGKKTEYVQYGSKIPVLKKLLPGVKVSILGPPTIKQKSDVLNQNPVNKEEYWHFNSFWKLRAATAEISADGANLFPDAPVYRRYDQIPTENRWFIQQLKESRANHLLGIVRAMDNALNNTSVILLIEAGKKKLLFPGDAQWENWEYTLKKDLDKLKDVNVYKVGHHGSLNATPKTLWEAFSHRSTNKDAPNRLMTVMSTRTDSKHGDPKNDSEVPRGKLVRALKRLSEHRSTQELEADGDLVMKLEFDL